MSGAFARIGLAGAALLALTGCGEKLDETAARTCLVSNVRSTGGQIEALAKLVGQQATFEVKDVRFGECLKAGPGEFTCQTEYTVRFASDNALVQLALGGKNELVERMLRKWRFAKGPTTFTCSPAE